MKIIEKKDHIQLGKRVYLPFELVDECPQCGKEHRMDLMRMHYLSYPIVGEP